MITSKINEWTSYILIVLLVSPHATKECVGTVCNGVTFVSPLLLGFLTPYVSLDMSLHGFLMQLLWSPIFVVGMYTLIRLRKHPRFSSVLSLDIVRYFLYTVFVVVAYNVLFWGGLRPFIFPSFIF